MKGPRAPIGKGGSGSFRPIGFNDFLIEMYQLVREKLKYFHMDNISLKTSVHWPSRSKLGLRQICRNVTVISCKNHAKQQQQAATFYARLKLSWQ